MKEEKFYKLLDEAFDHLWNGRFRLALPIAEKLVNDRPNDSKVAICYAWALLENGDPVGAMEYANSAVELNRDPLISNLYRGYLLMRMSIFEGAIADLEVAHREHLKYFVWSLENKAKAFAGLNNFDEALEQISLALNLDPTKNPTLPERYKLYVQAVKVSHGNKKLDLPYAKKIVEYCERAFKYKEYWFPLYFSRKITAEKDLAELHETALISEIEAMFYLFQYLPAFKKAEELKDRLSGNPRFEKVYKLLLPRVKKKKSLISKTLFDDDKKKTKEEKPVKKIDKSLLRSESLFYPHEKGDVFKLQIFDEKDPFFEKGVGPYYSSIDITKKKKIAVEVVFANPLFRIEDSVIEGKLAWYVNDFLISTNVFEVPVSNEWDSVVFSQPLENDKNFRQEGQGKVELYFDNFKVAETYFILSDKDEKIIAKPQPGKEDEKGDKEKTEIKNKLSSQSKIIEPEEKSIEELLKELDEFIGLESIKSGIRELIDYLKFQQKREKLGLKSSGEVNVHSLFIGNPGTGKTTIARLMGQLFRAMGILPKGHVVEVDRSALVGEFVGQTAQKTDQAIESALGGVLFIDEAYTLYKPGGKDFGQEAIDILLKRMEDKKGEFIVIAAGYPDEMESFLQANPGLKSRFNRKFIFEDYTPDEMMKIFELMLNKNEYEINDEAREFLAKKLLELYRKRDKNFGNAREVRRIFDKAKLNLSKRLLKLSEDELKEITKEQFSTFVLSDIEEVFSEETAKNVKLGIDEEELEAAMNELNSLIGINPIKEEVNRLVKLARYFAEQGEDLKSKFSDHILFLGNPGTGKTTVARIISKIFSALGVLEKGHLVETDREGLVSGFIGQTAEKTMNMINKAMGGTLFIDEAYTLVKPGDEKDFGKEAIDTLLKQMEDNKGKFIVIAAGYTDEMKKFIESNPGMKSRFSKIFEFEDYTPDELIEVAKKLFKSKNLTLDKKAEEKLRLYLMEQYRNRDKTFGNVRLVRNIVEKTQQQHLLRLADLTPDEREKIPQNLVTVEDILPQISEKRKTEKFAIEGNPEKLQQLLEELNSLTGLDNVKSEVNRLVKSLKVTKMRQERGLKVIDRSLHSVFTGNPGTGKTTVARLLSGIYKELGLLEKGHLVECDRSALVAGYQGQTAIKADGLIKQALGGTLFIDEAYTLSRGANDFGQEAIDILLKRMEDYKGKFAVIVAGYTEEMEQFLSSNPGLQSRFQIKLHFEDYTPRQLLEIAYNIGNANGYVLDEGALQLLLEIFEKLYEKRDKNFGNARTAKNILFKIISYQEERISNSVDLTDNDFVTLTYEDVQSLIENSDF